MRTFGLKPFEYFSMVHLLLIPGRRDKLRHVAVRSAWDGSCPGDSL